MPITQEQARPFIKYFNSLATFQAIIEDAFKIDKKDRKKIKLLRRSDIQIVPIFIKALEAILYKEPFDSASVERRSAIHTVSADPGVAIQNLVGILSERKEGTTYWKELIENYVVVLYGLEDKEFSLSKQEQFMIKRYDLENKPSTTLKQEGCLLYNNLNAFFKELLALCPLPEQKDEPDATTSIWVTYEQSEKIYAALSENQQKLLSKSENPIEKLYKALSSLAIDLKKDNICDNQRNAYEVSVNRSSANIFKEFIKFINSRPFSLGTHPNTTFSTALLNSNTATSLNTKDIDPSSESGSISIKLGSSVQ